MREIKFRALVNGEWLYFDLTQNPKYWAHKLKDGIIVQYTDLKDMNGREIYDGDIIVGKGLNFQGIGIVRYFAPRFEVVFAPNFEVVGIKQYESLFRPLESCCEVIGNIHENPELLLEEKTHDR